MQHRSAFRGCIDRGWVARRRPMWFSRCLAVDGLWRRNQQSLADQNTITAVLEAVGFDDLCDSHFVQFRDRGDEIAGDDLVFQWRIARFTGGRDWGNARGEFGCVEAATPRRYLNQLIGMNLKH